MHSFNSIHSIVPPSDIAFEEQEEALAPAGPEEVKVVIATNAAESSITLPDVDDVICLGNTMHPIPYSNRMHNNIILPYPTYRILTIM